MTDLFVSFEYTSVEEGRLMGTTVKGNAVISTDELISVGVSSIQTYDDIWAIESFLNDYPEMDFASILYWRRVEE